MSAGEVRVTSSTGGQKGSKQARLGSIDPKALLTLAEVAGFGEQKYSRLNFLNGYDWSLSFDATERHLLNFWAGENLDLCPDDCEFLSTTGDRTCKNHSGLPHLAHAAWGCLALLAFLQHDLGTDDRFVKA